MCCLLTAKTAHITCFLLESYKNTRTKRKSPPKRVGFLFFGMALEIGLEPIINGSVRWTHPFAEDTCIFAQTMIK